jgi:transcriptional regulator with XRE-family HTH domain|tara:strand:+ start:248 stop:778 length:531 start_codon:yes stop_codon:yes gene_type:complete
MKRQRKGNPHEHSDMSIQKRRLDKGWTQEQLAEHAGLSVRTIQRIESGNPATLESLKCLAAVFETSVTRLTQEPETMSNLTRDPSQKEAQERDAIQYVQTLKGFHMHWLSYVLIMPGLYVLNIVMNPDRLWVITVALGWGVGVLLHGLTVFGFFKFFGGDWEQRQFKKRMDELNRR